MKNPKLEELFEYNLSKLPIYIQTLRVVENSNKKRKTLKIKKKNTTKCRSSLFYKEILQF